MRWWSGMMAVIGIVVIMAASRSLGGFLGSTSQEEDQVREYLVQAKELADGGQNEIAASKLRAARDLMKQFKPSKDLAREVQEMMREVDPNDTLRRREFARAAKDVIKVAKKYRDDGWDGTALEVLDIAYLLDPDEAGPIREAIAERLRREGLGRASFGGEMFREPMRLFGQGRWSAKLDELSSPPLEENVIETQCILSEDAIRGTAELSFEINVDQEAAKVGMFIGYQSANLPCYLVELNQQDDVRNFRIFEYVDGDLVQLETTSEAGGPETLPDWIPISIRWDDETLRATCGTQEFVLPRESRIFEGSFGPFISGDSPKRTSVRYRGLRIRSLED